MVKLTRVVLQVQDTVGHQQLRTWMSSTISTEERGSLFWALFSYPRKGVSSSSTPSRSYNAGLGDVLTLNTKNLASGAAGLSPSSTNNSNNYNSPSNPASPTGSGVVVAVNSQQHGIVEVTVEDCVPWSLGEVDPQSTVVVLAPPKPSVGTRLATANNSTTTPAKSMPNNRSNNSVGGGIPTANASNGGEIVIGASVGSRGEFGSSFPRELSRPPSLTSLPTQMSQGSNTPEAELNQIMTMNEGIRRANSLDGTMNNSVFDSDSSGGENSENEYDDDDEEDEEDEEELEREFQSVQATAFGAASGSTGGVNSSIGNSAAAAGTTATATATSSSTTLGTTDTLNSMWNPRFIGAAGMVQAASSSKGSTTTSTPGGGTSTATQRSSTGPLVSSASASTGHPAAVAAAPASVQPIHVVGVEIAERAIALGNTKDITPAGKDRLRQIIAEEKNSSNPLPYFVIAGGFRTLRHLGWRDGAIVEIKDNSIGKVTGAAKKVVRMAVLYIEEDGNKNSFQLVISSNAFLWLTSNCPGALQSFAAATPKTSTAASSSPSSSSTLLSQGKHWFSLTTSAILVTTSSVHLNMKLHFPPLTKKGFAALQQQMNSDGSSSPLLSGGGPKTPSPTSSGPPTSSGGGGTGLFPAILEPPVASRVVLQPISLHQLDAANQHSTNTCLQQFFTTRKNNLTVSTGQVLCLPTFPLRKLSSSGGRSGGNAAVADSGDDSSAPSTSHFFHEAFDHDLQVLKEAAMINGSLDGLGSPSNTLWYLVAEVVGNSSSSSSSSTSAHQHHHFHRFRVDPAKTALVLEEKPIVSRLPCWAEFSQYVASEAGQLFSHHPVSTTSDGILSSKGFSSAVPATTRTKAIKYRSLPFMDRYPKLLKLVQSANRQQNEENTVTCVHGARDNYILESVLLAFEAEGVASSVVDLRKVGASGSDKHGGAGGSTQGDELVIETLKLQMKALETNNSSSSSKKGGVDATTPSSAATGSKRVFPSGNIALVVRHAELLSDTGLAAQWLSAECQRHNGRTESDGGGGGGYFHVVLLFHGFDPVPAFFSSLSTGGGANPVVEVRPPSLQERELIVKSVLSSLYQEHRFLLSLFVSTSAKEAAQGIPSPGFLAKLVEMTVGYTVEDIYCWLRLAWLKALALPQVEGVLPTVTPSSSSSSSTPPSILVEGLPVLDSPSFEAVATEYQQQQGKNVTSSKIQPIRWSDVGGLETAKREVRETIEMPMLHPELYEGLKQRAGVLFYGPPGCGKTLLAKAVATELNLNFMSVKGPELINMYVGESERNIRQLFQQARDAAPCIVFFDEIDALAPARGSKGDSGGVMDRIVAQLLAEVDGVSKKTSTGETAGRVFIIAATNRPDLLDPSLTRPGRFDRLCYLGMPENHYEQLLAVKALTRKFNLAEDVDLSGLVEKLEGPIYTGADLFAFCSDALMLAVDDVVAQLAEDGEEEEEDEGDSSQRKNEEKGMASPSATKKKDDDTPQVLVRQCHFLESLSRLQPSVKAEDLAKYEALRKQFQTNS